MVPSVPESVTKFHFALKQPKPLTRLTTMCEFAESPPLHGMPAPKPSLPERPTELSAVQIDIIDIFVHLFQTLGLPKSVGEIYGLLFVSATVMSFEEVMAKLGISSGSVSQGLRLLRSLGAVRATYVAGDRRDHYLAETDLRRLASSFLRGNIERHLLNGEERLSRLNKLLSGNESLQGAARAFLEERVGTLRAWNEQARAVLPMVIQGLQ